jgi:hypothetical protein
VTIDDDQDQLFRQPLPSRDYQAGDLERDAECLRAKATFVFFMPARLARRRLQHFNAPPLTGRVIVTLAAS